MRGSERASLELIGLLLHSLEVVFSANTGFSMSIYDVTSRSIYLRWSKFSGASSYRVTATAVNTVGHSLLAHFSDVTLKSTLTSLIPNTVYAIQAEAIDKNGIILAETQTMQSTAPDIPVIDQAYSKLSNSITVEWRAVPGATSYLLSAQDGDSCIETVVTKSPGTVMGLEPATCYRITIRSVNAGGKSRPSPSRKTTTVLSAPILSVSSPSYDSIAVSWKAVYMAVGFSVSLMRSDGLGRMLKQNTTNTSFIFSNLDPGTLYTIKAYAWNANGLPGDDFTYNQRTIPCAPGNISTEEDEHGNLLVSWSRVNFGHYYVVFVKSDDGLEVYCNTSHTQCHFQSDCGFTYFISVFAYNKAGQSPLGDVFNYTTAPCCPSNFRAVLVSSDTVEVSWSPVRGAEMYETKAASWRGTVLCNDTATACTLSALRCDTRYNVTVYSFSEARGSNTSCASKYVATAPCSPEIKNISKEALSVISVHWQSNNEEATYIVTARGETGLWHCTSSGNSCTLINLPCGSAFSVSVIARSPAGQSLPSYSVPLETAPCCPNDLTLTQVTQSVTNISWSIGMGAQTYATTLESPKGQAKCRTLKNYCLLGCITCGTNYTVSLKAISETGLTSYCTYQGYSSSACCPSGVKLYRLGNNGIRVYWRASEETISYITDLCGSKGNFTCTPSSGVSYCDITEIPCGDVYTVVVSPATDKRLKLTFCPKKIYSVTCSGSSVGMGKNTQYIHFNSHVHRSMLPLYKTKLQIIYT
ncbi:fibronectin type III domain-containing protein 7 isoform X6 [Gallus gallus]|uniref:fibronectin type III domain-containing protein 7 isoform X6 n=1 Tax=Gallus gallus TaxID=9031 RepID=UPI001AE4EC3A|nr:fibronectin type III domain-containing protein 7 isoform X6 [Gallus gallus]